MGSEWPRIFLEDGPLKIFDGDRGKNYPKRTEFKSSGHCVFLNTGNVTQRGFEFSSTDFVSEERDSLLGKGKLQREDVVLTTRGTVGNSAYYDAEIPHDHVRINSGMVILRSNVDVLFPRFLYLFVRSQTFGEQVSALQSGSAQPQLPIRDLRRFEIPLPPLPEQKAIAHILGTLDDKIALNRRMNATLEGMAQALFKSWFVDFDPVIDNALAAGNAIPAELESKAEFRRLNAEKLKSATHNSSLNTHNLRSAHHLFPNSFQETEELGGIPEGWEVTPLGEVTTELRRGISPKYTEDEGVRVINQRCIRDHAIMFSNARRNDTTKKKVDGRLLKPGDLLINSTGVGTLGRIAQIQILEEPTVIDSHVTVARPDQDQYMPYIFGRMMISLEPQIEAMGHGSTGQTELSRADLSVMPVIVPSQPTQELAEVLLSDWATKAEQNSTQSNTLTKLRDTLLPKLISGDLRVYET